MTVNIKEDRVRLGKWHRRLVQTAGFALSIAVSGATDLSSTLALQNDDTVPVSGDVSVVDEEFIHSILAQVFGEVFGDEVAVDGGVSGGDINVGGNTGGNITMGGGSGGGISIGEGSGGSGSGAME